MIIPFSFNYATTFCDTDCIVDNSHLFRYQTFLYSNDDFMERRQIVLNRIFIAYMVQILIVASSPHKL